MLRPRRLLHRGSVEAAGFLFDVRLLGEREARRRLLACWQTGAQVFRLPEQYVLRLGSPLRVDASRAPGAVLLSVKDFLTTIPLEAEELDGLFYPANSVVQLRGGRVLCEPLTSEQLEDPAAWLDLQDFQLAPVQTLGMIYERPRTVAEPVSFDPRSRLKGVPPPAPELLERLAELKTMQGGRNASATEGTLRGRAARGKSLSNFFGALGDLLRGMFHSGRRAASGDEALQ